ncbi:hypothetical protein LX16_3257 [Stackebrandtia albiflava]|uniref:Uncharacterized protein n=1 Tax=Stackebrandtia albiflava TaxID=406432 RepID=A0A562V3M0_9ACTN|nr:hypothetical protein [Stackebrandtia albiflava]TWJ12499.1 hypothetical protein LX16_3257 [Stackebrandtia albiflava]
MSSVKRSRSGAIGMAIGLVTFLLLTSACGRYFPTRHVPPESLGAESVWGVWSGPAGERMEFERDGTFTTNGFDDDTGDLVDGTGTWDVFYSTAPSGDHIRLHYGDEQARDDFEKLNVGTDDEGLYLNLIDDPDADGLVILRQA